MCVGSDAAQRSTPEQSSSICKAGEETASKLGDTYPRKMCETEGPVGTCSSEWGVNLRLSHLNWVLVVERDELKSFIVLLLKCLNIAVAVSQCFCKYRPLVAWDLPDDVFYLALVSLLYSCSCSVSNRTEKFCSILESFTWEVNRWNNADPSGQENPALPKVNKELAVL